MTHIPLGFQNMYHISLGPKRGCIADMVHILTCPASSLSTAPTAIISYRMPLTTSPGGSPIRAPEQEVGQQDHCN